MNPETKVLGVHIGFRLLCLQFTTGIPRTVCSFQPGEIRTQRDTKDRCKSTFFTHKYTWVRQFLVQQVPGRNEVEEQ